MYPDLHSEHLAPWTFCLQSHLPFVLHVVSMDPCSLQEQAKN